MPGRSNNSGDYRYAYNGMEQDNEVSDNGNSYTTEFRQYDPRLMRWKSLDPLAFKAPGWNPYRFAFDNPILFTDENGLFEDRKSAQAYKKEHGIKGNVKYNKSEKVWEVKAKTIIYIKGDDAGVTGDAHKNDGVVEFAIAEPKSSSYGVKDFEYDWDPMNNNKIQESLGLTYTGLNSYNLVNKATEEGALYMVATNYKSNSNTFAFLKLKDSKQNWRIAKTLGKEGKVALQRIQVAGNFVTVVIPVIHGYNMYLNANDGDPNTNNTTMDNIDLAVEVTTATTVILSWGGVISNPVGWVVGAGGFLYGLGRYATDSMDNMNEIYKDEFLKGLIDSPIEQNSPDSPPMKKM